MKQVWNFLEKGLPKIMKKNNINRKDWLVYLNNLNNREIGKRSSSGFTNWALFGLIGFTLFKLLDSLPIIFMNINNIFLSKLFITNIFNLFIVISIITPALILPLSLRRRIYNELMKKIITSITGILYFVYIVGFFCNVYIISDLIFYGLSILPYCIFATFDIFMIIGLLIINRITAKKDKKMPRIDSGYYYTTKYKNPHKPKAVFLCLVLLSTLLFSIYQIKQNYYILDHLSVLKSVIYLILFIGAIILFIGNSIIHMKNRWLEEFERKIMLQNLDEKEIVKEFIDKFVGKDIAQWLKEIEDETKKGNTRTMRLYNEFEKKINNLNQKEKDLNKRIMIQKNLSKLAKVTINCFTKYSEKYENNAEKINHFLKQGPLSNEEDLLIKEYIRYLEKKHKTQLDIIPRLTTLDKEVEKYVDATNELKKKKDK